MPATAPAHSFPPDNSTAPSPSTARAGAGVNGDQPGQMAGILSLLAEIDTTSEAVSDQLARAASQLSAMHCAGELDGLPSHTRTAIAGLALFMLGAADRVREIEHAARPVRAAVAVRWAEPDELAALREQGMRLTDDEAACVARWCGVRS